MSDFVLKIASNKYRERLQLNSRKTDTLFIAEKFFKDESFFGDLYNKLTIEHNRLARQQSMLSQTQAILVTIELELTQE